MGDVLSQHEIDTLLQALSTGEVAVEEVQEHDIEKKAKLYDFKNPKKFAQDQIRTLGIIYENVARNLTTLLSTALRTNMQVSVATVEQIAYNEFLRSLPEPTVIGVYSMKPLDGMGVIEISSSLAFILLDRMLGGSGTAIPVKQRPFTEIEKKLFASQLFKRLLAIKSGAWSNVMEVSARLEQMESNPQVTQVVSPNEVVVLITLSIEVADEQGFIHIALPFLMLEQVLPKLTTRYWYSNLTQKSPDKDRTIIQSGLRNVVLNIGVCLGRSHIQVKDLLELRPGDVIELDTKVNDEITINIDGKPKFLGHPGRIGKHVGVQISRYMEGEGANG